MVLDPITISSMGAGTLAISSAADAQAPEKVEANRPASIINFQKAKPVNPEAKRSAGNILAAKPSPQKTTAKVLEELDSNKEFVQSTAYQEFADKMAKIKEIKNPDQKSTAISKALNALIIAQPDATTQLKELIQTKRRETGQALVA